MIIRPNLNSITNRLLLLDMSLLIIGALGRVFLLTDFLRKDLTAVTSSQLMAFAQYVANDINHEIIERKELLNRLSKQLSPELLQNKNQLQVWLKNSYDINPLFSGGIVILDNTGSTIIDYPASVAPTEKTYAKNELVQNTLKNHFYVGTPIASDDTHHHTIPIATTVTDKNNKVYAIILGISELRTSNFMESLHHTKIGDTGGFILISPRDQLVIDAYDTSMILTPTPTKGVDKLLDQAILGFRGVGVTKNAQGVEQLVAFASIPQIDWFISARISTDEAFMPISHLRSYIQRNTLIMVPAFLLCMIFLMRQILRPLMNAAHLADQMTKGEIPYEPLPVVRDDEVGHLTKAFNRLLTKLLESKSKLEHLAHHDSLTGLPNRKLLEDRMNQAQARAKRNRIQISLLFIDLDGFKPINDELGHDAGDIALCSVANRLSEIVRREDTLARVGGDEFVILLSDLAENNARESTELVAKKCLDAFKEAFNIKGQPRTLGTSIGIAMGSGSSNIEKMLTAADHAIYEAKRTGRSRFYWSEDYS